MEIESAFTNFPVLTTGRLQLRQIEATDALAFFAFKSDPKVAASYGQEPHRSVQDSLAWIQRLQADYVQRTVLFWCLTLKGEPKAIGEVIFWNFDPGFHCAEIGYELHPAYWQQGFMAEALSAVLAFGFDQLGLNRIEANPLAENAASRRILLKLGFSYEGNLRQRHFFRDRFIDQLYFGLLKEEWQGSS